MQEKYIEKLKKLFIVKKKIVNEQDMNKKYVRILKYYVYGYLGINVLKLQNRFNKFKHLFNN